MSTLRRLRDISTLCIVAGCDEIGTESYLNLKWCDKHVKPATEFVRRVKSNGIPPLIVGSLLASYGLVLLPDHVIIGFTLLVFSFSVFLIDLAERRRRKQVNHENESNRARPGD